MASSSTLSIGWPGSNIFVGDHVGRWSIDNQSNNRCVVTGDQGRSRRARKGRILATTGSLEPIWKYEGGAKDNGRRNDAADAYERLDEWMKDSVVEIVKNLKEAPLLVQVFPQKKGNGGGATALRTEKKAVVDDWEVVMEEWGRGETPLPEGVILVGELAEEEEGRERTTKAWGILVQGRGEGTGPVCYLLKTSRVDLGPGTGQYCTHFCLVRVTSFRETVKSQLKNCWLLQGQ